MTTLDFRDRHRQLFICLLTTGTLLLVFLFSNSFFFKKRLPTLIFVLFDGGEGSSYFVESLKMCTIGFEPVDCYGKCQFNATAKSLLLSAIFRTVQEPTRQRFEEAANIADSWNLKGDEIRRAPAHCKIYALKARLVNLEDSYLLRNQILHHAHAVTVKFVVVSRNPLHAAISQLRYSHGRGQFVLLETSNFSLASKPIILSAPELRQQIKKYIHSLTMRLRFLIRINASFIVVDYEDVQKRKLVRTVWEFARSNPTWNVRKSYFVKASGFSAREKVLNWPSICHDVQSNLSDAFDMFMNTPTSCS